MGQIGTKAQFGSWLQTVKRITYTKYTTLAPAAKQSIQAEYRGKKVKHEPGQSDSAQEGTSETVS